MKNKRVLITGSTDGIGRESAIRLAQMGADVIVHGRSADRVAAVCKEIHAETGEWPESFVADFSSLKDVTRLAQGVGKKPLHILLNNAGLWSSERRLTVDNYEMTFAVNQLAPFLLTNLLHSSLQSAGQARVITVASIAHQSAHLEDWENLQGERKYDAYGAYALSKLANILFAFELARRWKDSGITSTTLHPGVIDTKLLRQGFQGASGASLESGSKTSVYLASSEEVASVTGEYFVNCRITAASALAREVKNQHLMWERCCELVGLA